MLEFGPGSAHAPVVELSREAVLERICVRPPYYALTNEHVFNETFVAEARAELPQGRALGPMRPGDVSRHGAIAGSCVLALRQSDNKRRYYLATQATYQGFPVEAPYGAPVRFEARVNHLDKRRAQAVVHAFVAGEPLAVLDVNYTVLAPTLFERLHATRRRATRRLDTLHPVGDYPVRWTGNRGVRTIPRLPLSACGGHFDDYPAAPVALLMDQLAQVAESFVGKPCYIARGEVTAAQLCWAGEEAVFSMVNLQAGPDEAQFSGGIDSNDAPVGTMKVWLRY